MYYQLSELCQTDKDLHEFIALTQEFCVLPHTELVNRVKRLGLDPSALVSYNRGTFRMDDPKYSLCLAMILAAQSTTLENNQPQ